MTFRPYLLLTLLCFCRPRRRAGRHPSGAARSSPLVPPDYWQSSDWQGNTRQHQGGQATGTVCQARQRQLRVWSSCCPTGSAAASLATDPGAGAPRFRYPAAAPRRSRPSLDPAAEKKQQVIDDFRKQFASRISKLGMPSCRRGLQAAAGPGYQRRLGCQPSSPANSCPPPMPWCCSTASSPTS